MWKILKAKWFRKSELLFLFNLILISFMLNSLDAGTYLFSPCLPSSNQSIPSEKESYPQKNQENASNFEINKLITNEEQIQYYVEQGTQFNLKNHQMKNMVSNSYTNVSIKSEVINSSFQIFSTGNSSGNKWQNDIEPDYGDVNVSTILSENTNVFRLNFSENVETPASGITNTEFLVSSNPDVFNYPTIISFDFRIPFLTPALINSPHTLGLEFRYNNGSITFILSDFGGNLGEILEENVTRPNGSDLLYILCNETAPFGWRHISYNITKLINTYFFSEENSKFSSLETLFCYMITFTPEYKLTLDINNLEYLTPLLPCPPINYSIGETSIFTSNGSLSFDSTLGNFTFTAYESSSWKNNSQTYLEVNITRTKSLESFYFVKDWNETKIRINLYVDIPNILEAASSSIIGIILPSDWININIINQSIKFEFTNKTQILNEFILGYLYRADIYGINWGVIEAWSPNYFTNIVVPTDVSRNDVIQVRGDLRYPLLGNINLYYYNESFLFHQTTLPMINSTFFFPTITITEQFPIGILHLTLNWSNSWEYGIYEKLVYVHEEVCSNSIILFKSSQNVNIYRFEPLLINLSLLKDGNKYFTNSTLVFLIKGYECLFFSQMSHNDFILNVSHIIWDPGDYTLDVIASDGNLFFAKDVISITVKPASIFWSFENLQTTLLKNESISFRLYSYIHFQGEEYFQTLSGLNIRIWINDTVISNFQTNLKGFADINFDFEYPIPMEFLQVAVDGMLEGEVFKLQTLLFCISNETALGGGERAYIREIMRSPIRVNETFFIYYHIEYLNNNSNWFVPIESFSDLILAAYILRDNYVVGTNIDNHMLIWTLEANQSRLNDILVLELPCPTILVIKEVISRKFRIRLEAYSEITINNYSIEIDLKFLGFPFANITLLDSLNRDITHLFKMTIAGSTVSLFQLNTISGLEMCYFLEGYLQELEIIIKKPFQSFYVYNESISGSWEINTPINYSYLVLCTINDLRSWECYNTSLKTFSNASSLITAFLSPQRWNTSISIQLMVNYFDDLIIASLMQNFTISDPFAPTLDYSVQSMVDIIRIHTFVFEPEMASGIKNISLTLEDQSIASISFSLNHYVFEIPVRTIDSYFITVSVFDWAGNEKSSEVIDIKGIISGSSSLSNMITSEFFFPILLSLVIISGILIARMIRKRKTSIL